ncbi:MAG: spermidine synthase, partial [Myxococcota bacterium]
MTTWIALLGGFSVLVIEILGVHILAPWFGSSTIIWSQQIAIILLAMALGGWFGGNIARRKTALKSKLSQALACAAAFFMLLAFGVDYFASIILPQDLSLDQVAGLFQIGSFSTATIFFAPPVFFLSWLTPILVELRVEHGTNAGQASGRLGAIATGGSLLGIYFATFIAIPILGVRASIIIVAILLAISALIIAKRSKLTPLLLLLFAPLAVESPAAEANMPSGATIVESTTTPYQSLRVIEFEGGERWLQMNEGLDSYQSRYNPQHQWPGGYYDLFALLPLYINHGVKPKEQREYCILGYGAGSAIIPISIAEANNAWHAIGIELDPVVSRLAQQHMPLPEQLSEQVDVYSAIDARAALRFAPDGLDAVIVDAYSRQFEVPLHMATVEFFSEIHSKLSDGGVMCFNLGTTSIDLHSSTLAAIAAGMIETFGRDNVRLQHVARSRNWVLFARKNIDLPPLDFMAKLLPDDWPIEIGASCLP